MYINKLYCKTLALFLILLILSPPITKAGTLSAPNNMQVLQNPSTLSIRDSEINSPLKIMVPSPSITESSQDAVEKVKLIYKKVEERNKKDRAIPLPPGGATKRKANESSRKSATPVAASTIVPLKISAFAPATSPIATSTPSSATSSLPSSATSYTLSPITPSAKALAIAVQYPDKPATTPISYFQNLLFGNTFGTLRDYYRTVSKGSFVPEGQVVGLNQDTVFITLPHEKNYYSDNLRGYGNYPKNVQGLVADAVKALIAVNFDWSPYRNSDNEVPYLFVIHAGLGYESSSNDTDIHSSSWALNEQKITIGTTETTVINNFTIEPELINTQFGTLPSTLGVYVHEFGHSLGLPDLYDTTYISDGIGNWSLMARGSWAGPNWNGEVPVELDAWSKAFLGWVTPEIVPKGTTFLTIPQIGTSNGKVLLLNTQVTNEHFLVENRQKTSYDRYLDGSGLLIWHIDSSIADPNSIYWFNNTINSAVIDETSPPHHGIYLIEADGYHDLDYAYSNYNYGDDSDPFPGTKNKREIQGSIQEDPNLSTWDNQDSGLSLTNISNSSTEMTASVTVFNSFPTAADTVKPIITLEGASNLTIPVNTTYIDPGATANDNIDGDITNKIEVTNPVDTTKEGIYTIHYNVSDSSGNPADEMFRTVQVVAEIFTAKPVVQIGVNPNTNSAGLFIGIKDIKNDNGTIINDKTLTSYQLELNYDPTKVRVLDTYNEINLGTLVKTTKTSPSNSTLTLVNTLDQGSPNFDKLVFVPIVLTGSAVDSTLMTVKFLGLTDEGKNKIIVSEPVELKFQRGKIVNSLPTSLIELADALAGLQFLTQKGGDGIENGTGLEEGQVNSINMASIIQPTGVELGVRPSVKNVIALLQYLVNSRDTYFNTN